MVKVNVGICGLGTVGGGALTILQSGCDEITRRTGLNIQVTHVSLRSPKPDLNLGGIKVSDDVFAVANDPDVDIVLELVGGYELALDLVMTAIKQGKHVVTANKALIAEYGAEIMQAASSAGVAVGYEAAVAGGIPVIKALREGLAANAVQSVVGIINGTGNFILTEMRDKGRDFADVLAEAQALGYAEADPTFDVEGIDAAHKLTILAAIAFGMPLQFDRVYTQGISELDITDVTFADELGYSIKHLGIAKRSENGIEMRVHPTLVPKSQLLASVDGVMNAVMVVGDFVGPTLFYGAGAGAHPTASAVIADVIDIARSLGLGAESRVPLLGFQQEQHAAMATLSIGEVETECYLRFQVQDRAGVMADISGSLAQQGISMEAILQKEPQSDNTDATIIVLTNRVRESSIDAAIAELEKMQSTVGKVVKIRVDHLDN